MSKPTSVVLSGAEVAEIVTALVRAGKLDAPKGSVICAACTMDPRDPESWSITITVVHRPPPKLRLVP